MQRSASLTTLFILREPLGALANRQVGGRSDRRHWSVPQHVLHYEPVHFGWVCDRRHVTCTTDRAVPRMRQDLRKESSYGARWRRGTRAKQNQRWHIDGRVGRQ